MNPQQYPAAGPYAGYGYQPYPPQGYMMPPNAQYPQGAPYGQYPQGPYGPGGPQQIMVQQYGRPQGVAVMPELTPTDERLLTTYSLGRAIRVLAMLDAIIVLCNGKRVNSKGH